MIRPFNIIDANESYGGFTHIARRVKKCQNDTAKTYAVYLLMARMNMDKRSIVRATGLTYMFVTNSMERIRKSGIPLDHIAMRSEDIRKFNDRRIRIIAAVESIGNKAMTVYDIIDMSGVDYGTARVAAIGLSAAGILAKLGNGTSRVDTRATVYFAPHLALGAAAQYRCDECGSPITIYYPKRIIAGGTKSGEHNVACFICGHEQDPAESKLFMAEVW